MIGSRGWTRALESKICSGVQVPGHALTQFNRGADMKKPNKSRYTLIKGKYWIHYPDSPRQGPQPDGDTITFQADDLKLVRNLPWLSGRGPNINTRGTIPVRYEGIDALETHFSGAHQQLQYANAARDENLRLLGFRNVTFFSDLPNNVESVDENPLWGT